MVGRSSIVLAAAGVLGTGRAGVPLVAVAVILFPRIVTARASASSILGADN